MKPKIIVHGGASRSNDDEPDRKKDVINACKIGYEVLLKKDAVEAVEIAIRNLEASPFQKTGAFHAQGMEKRFSFYPWENKLSIFSI